MRWVFTADSDRAEQKRRKAVEDKMATFWAAFEDAADHLLSVVEGRDAWDPTDWMNQLLWPIEAGIIWELGAVRNGRAHLVLTAEATHSIRPLISRLIELAPEIPGWEVHGWRPPESEGRIAELLAARAKGLKLDAIRFEGRPGDHRRLDLGIFCDEFSPGDRAGAGLAGFVAELVLGEKDFYRWIGDVEVEESEGDEPSFIGRFFAKPKAVGRAMTDLKRAVSNHKSDLRQRQFPVANSYAGEWSSREYRTMEAEDYTGRSDMYGAKTPAPELWDAAHSELPFFSDCFGSSTFCYLKVDGQGDARSQLPGGDALAGTLQEVLSARGLGAVVGVGEGRRYHYVDLALTDVHAALEAMRDVLHPANLPLRSWLLFHDAEWTDEWVGVFEASPPPPRWGGVVGG